MLEIIWYSLLLLLQVVQVNPNIDVSRLDLEVYVNSDLVYSLKVQGSLVQGQLINSDSRSVLGEFEASRRVPQAYLIFPRQAPPEQLAGVSDTKATEGAPDNFNLDFTKALKTLKSFETNRVQRLSLDLLPQLKDDSSAKTSSSTPSATPKTSTTSIKPTGTASGQAQGTASEQTKAKSDYGLEIRVSGQRVVLTVPSAGLLVLLSYR